MMFDFARRVYAGYRDWERIDRVKTIEGSVRAVYFLLGALGVTPLAMVSAMPKYNNDYIAYGICLVFMFGVAWASGKFEKKMRERASEIKEELIEEGKL